MIRRFAVLALLLACDDHPAKAEPPPTPPTRMILKESNLSDGCNETRVWEDPVEHNVCYQVNNRFGCGERSIALSCVKKLSMDK